MVDVYPAIDLIGGRCVRLEQGDYDKELKYDFDPLERSLEYSRLGARRIHVVDLEGARDGSGVNREVVARIVHRLPVPVEFGGGIRSDSDVRKLIDMGVNYLILGTVGLTDPEKVVRWARTWGRDRFILSLDLRAGRLRTAGWRKPAECTLEEAIERATEWGISQVICTDISRDGSLEQPGYDTLARVRSLLDPKVRLIAAGGVSRPEQLAELGALGVNAAIVGRALYEGDFRLEDFLDVG